MAQAHRVRLYADGLCRAVRARANAMKRSPDQTPQKVNAYYAPLIAGEQTKRRAAGLPEGGRASRDREHARRKARRPRASAPVAREAP